MKTVCCKKCGEHIDRADCKNKYATITLVDNTKSPIKKKTYYFCSNCLVTTNLYWWLVIEKGR